MRTLRWIVLLLIAPGLAACDSVTTPLAPSPTGQAGQAGTQPDPNPAPTQTRLTGYVADSAFRSLAGARLEVINGPQTGLSATTDSTGQFEMFGTFDDTTRLRAAKEGYVDATGTIAPRCGTCPAARRWISLFLGVPAPPVNLAGDYTLTFMADSACTDLPPDLRTRTYEATIRPLSGANRPEGTGFIVTLGGAVIDSDWNTFSIGVAGDFVTFAFWGDPLSLVEHVAPRTTLAFGGRAEVSVAAPVSTISTTFEGVIDYCVLKAGTSQFWQCDSPAAEVHVACESKNHGLTLTRR